MKRSSVRGAATAAASGEGVTPFGVWLLVAGEELFASHADFPMFRSGTIGALMHVELHGADHLYWPELDVDLDLKRVANPEKFPLVARSGNFPA